MMSVRRRETELQVAESAIAENGRSVISNASRGDKSCESIAGPCESKPKEVIHQVPQQVAASPSPPRMRVTSDTYTEMPVKGGLRGQGDQKDMLIAAAVTMAPPEERAEFLSTLSDTERAGALRWMDPQDLAEALELCVDAEKLLYDIPLTGTLFAPQSPLPMLRCCLCYAALLL